MTICGFCSSSISARKSSISCDVCKKQFHANCINEATDISHLLADISGLSWKCDVCTQHCITINQSDICKFLEEKIKNALSLLDSTFVSLKSDFMKIAAEKFDTLNEPPSSVHRPNYADALKNKSQPAVIVLPKNQNQSNIQTKSDIKEKINPIESNLKLSKVRNVKNGGILIGCQTQEDNEKFSKMVQDKLSDSYEIREVRGINPRIRVVGITEKFEDNELLNIIKKSNTGLISSKCDLKLIKYFPTKKNKHIFQAVLQLDKLTYDKVIRVGNLFVNYDSCVIYDAIEIYRCFTCNQFNHSSNKCNKPLSCPRCGEQHDIKSCKSNTLYCTNCSKLDNVSTDHAAWDVNKCTAYIRERDKLRNDILGPQ